MKRDLLFRKNASLNSIENVEFICGKAEDVLPDILERKLNDAESLFAIVDPPRAGLHKKVLHVSGGEGRIRSA